MTNCVPGLGCRPRRRGMGLVCIAEDDAGNCIMYDGSGSAGTTPTPTITPPSAATSWLQNLISGVAKTGENILTQQNLAKGVYTSTGPGGTVTYVQPAGTAQNIFGASQTGVLGGVTGSGSSMGVILIGGAALLLVFMMAKK